MEYVRITKGTSDFGKLIPADEDVYKHIRDKKTAHFKSLYYYSEEHYKQFQEKRTIAGITDVSTDKILFDFDCEENLEKAREDARELCTRLITRGIPQDRILVFFSGKKGFGVEVTTTSRFTPQELQNINASLAGDLETNDKKVLNASRIIRTPLTKHDETPYYKMPLTVAELCESPIDSIREAALNVDDISPTSLMYEPVELPDSILSLKGVVPKRVAPVEVVDTSELTFDQKPKGFTNCKYAIMNGFFEAGERSNALMALAATCKFQGYPKEIAYNILKGAARMQAQRTGTTIFSKAEIWHKIIGQVYGPHWKGAQYSCRTQGWLKDICDSLGEHKCKVDSEKPFSDIADIFGMFKDFAANIDRNTIKTGIDSIDSEVRITTHQSVGILGAPGSGKTSLALSILNNTSKAGINSVFISADMAAPLVVQKKLQKLTGESGEKLYYVAQNQPKRMAELEEQLKEEYKNVKFSFKSGLTIQEIRDSISRQEEVTGEKVKLLIIDYLECLGGPYSDTNANISYIANATKDLANELGICSMMLLQPPKAAGDASSPLTSMRQIKGASTLEQSFSLVLGIFREGFGPTRLGRDKFITVNSLKNRMGPLFQVDCAWDGLRGAITVLPDEGHQELEQLRKDIKDEQAAKANEF